MDTADSLQMPTVLKCAPPKKSLKRQDSTGAQQCTHYQVPMDHPVEKAPEVESNHDSSDLTTATELSSQLAAVATIRRMVCEKILTSSFILDHVCMPELRSPRRVKLAGLENSS